MSSYFHVWSFLSSFVSILRICWSDFLVRVFMFWMCSRLDLGDFRVQFYGDFMQSFSGEKHNVKSSWTCRMNSNILRIVLFWCNRCVELRTRQRCGETTASARECNVQGKNGESSNVLQRVLRTVCLCHNITIIQAHDAAQCG